MRTILVTTIIQDDGTADPNKWDWTNVLRTVARDLRNDDDAQMDDIMARIHAAIGSHPNVVPDPDDDD